jgi:hypothetical protein
MRLGRLFRSVALPLLVPVFAGWGAAPDAPAPAGSRPPFVERTQPADFFAVEKSLPVVLNPDADIAIICTEDGRPAYALVLGKNADSEYEVVFFNFGPEDSNATSAGPARLAVPLDAASAEKLQRALAIRMARNVVLSDARRVAKDYDRAWWILQRSGAKQMQAALIAGEGVELNLEAREFMDAIVYGLQRYATSPLDERSGVLFEIDRYTIKTILGEQGRK